MQPNSLQQGPDTLRSATRTVGRQASTFTTHFLPPALLIIGVLLLTEICARAGLTGRSLPPPSEVAISTWHDGSALFNETLSTLFVAIYGFIAATLISLTLAFIVYTVRRTETTIMTAAAVLSSVPIMAIMPMLLIWMGPFVSTRIVLTCLICVFPIIVSAIQGVQAAGSRLDDLFTVMAARPWQRFRRLALPVAVPYLFVGLRIAAPLSILGALVAEWSGASSGLGVLMLNAMFSLQIDRLWSTVLIACCISLAAYGYICLIERLALPAERVIEGASV